MTITIPRAELSAALAGLSHVVTKRVTLPVLTCVKFHAVDGKLAATGTDLDQVATFRGFATPAEKDLSMVVPVSHLKRALVLCDEPELTVETAGESVVKISGGSARMKLFGFPESEFPNWPAKAMALAANTPAGDFVTAFKAASLTASTDENRAILNGVYCTADGELVATDGRRMSMLNNCPVLPTPVVIPATPFLLRARLGADVKVGSGLEAGPLFALSSSLWSYMVKTVAGTFPNWKMVIPNAKPDAAFTIPEMVRRSLAKRLPLISTDPLSPFTLEVKASGEMTFTTKHPDAGEVEVKAMAEAVTVGPRGFFSIAFNCGSFVDALSQGFVRWEGTNEISPMKATRADGSGVHVLMPTRVR